MLHKFPKNIHDVEQHINAVWDKTRLGKVDWLGLEVTIRDILSLVGEGKVAGPRALVLIDEAQAAYTRRGYGLPDSWAGDHGGRLQ